MKLLKMLILIYGIYFYSNCFVYAPITGPGSDSGGELTEQVVSGTDKDKILIIPIEGVISDSPSEVSFFGTKSDSMVSKIKEQLKRAEIDKNIRAIILKINSPGGTVTASDVIFNEIKNFRKKNNIPVVSIFMDTAASGAYYVAMSSDFIAAHPTSVTGSIGVIMQGLNFKDGLGKLGIKDMSYTSGANKGLGSPFTEPGPEQKKILQSIVDSLFHRFFTVVKEGRPNIKEDVLRALCDGRIYSADQAVQNGLVDKIVYFDEIIPEVMKQSNYKKSADNENPRLIILNTSKKPVRNIYSTVTENFQEETLLNKIIKTKVEARFMYLWAP
ncbi:MAG: signal peptide peptidase SppA [Leptospira sp.]|nr:signal peptide peptidase SppA [Leptospira sp.]